MNDLWSNEHITRLQEALVGHPLEALVTLALLTGMRRDELLDLRWSAIDLEHRTVRVRSSKHAEQTRTLPLDARLSELLGDLRIHQSEAHQQASAGEGLDEQVFLDPNHEPLNTASFLHAWRTLCQDAGLPPLPFHMVRASVWSKLRAIKEEARGEGHRFASLGALVQDRAGFRAFLEAQRERLAGWSHNERDSPVSNWLRRHYGLDIEVFVSPEAICINPWHGPCVAVPTWARQFGQALDAFYPQEEPVVGAVALSILDACETGASTEEELNP